MVWATSGTMPKLSRRLNEIMVTAAVPNTTINTDGKLKNDHSEPPIAIAATMSESATANPRISAPSTVVLVGGAS